MRWMLPAWLMICSLCVGANARTTAGHKLERTSRPLVVFPHIDAEEWTLLRFPAKRDLDIAGMEMENVGAARNFESHHLRIFAATARTPLTTIAGLRKGWTPAFGWRESMDLVGGSQTMRSRQVAPDGLALRLKALAQPGSRKRYLWLAVDSHWINGGDTKRRARVRVRLVPAVPPVKRFLKPIFEGTANAGLFVPQGTVRSTEDSTQRLNGELVSKGIPLVLSDSWGPGQVGVGDIASGSGALPSPRGPACVTFLTAHMHLRGTFFAVDFIDSDGQVKNGAPDPSLGNPYEPGRFHLFVSRVYNEPAEIHFEPARYLTAGQRFHYACWHDNGVRRPPKLTCQDFPGQVPGTTAADVELSSGGGAGYQCHTLGPDPDECHFGNGDCVEANLVFGSSADDDMCILPGAYYDPDPAAPPGHECDLALMAPLP